VRRAEPPREAEGLLVLRLPILFLLAAAPLALGAVHEPAFIPLLAIGSVVGLASWARGYWSRAHGIAVPPVAGGRLLVALHALVLVQLLPLPPLLLRLVSPGSFAFYDSMSLVPLGWRPVTVNPADTARGFAFLAGVSLLYAAVFREFGDERWRRRLAATVVLTACVMTLAALVQAASADPTRIYGLWKPQWDWGVFGPYVSRNHFAGYVAMAIPVALGFAAEAALAVRRSWASRRFGFVALGEPAGVAAMRRGAAAMVLMVGLLASHSRGGLLAFAAGSLVVLFFLRRGRALVFALVGAVAVAGFLWVDVGATRTAFTSRGLQQSRLALWADAIRMLKHFPLLGAGFNAFGTSYTQYQTIERYEWYGEAHNEYLQALLDTGLLGAALVGALLVRLVRSGVRAAEASAVDAGILGGLLACCAHNLVDFNWQIPANAATFAALAGLAMRQAAALAAHANLTARDPLPRIDPLTP
jgi:O-antigen ligase